MQQRCGSCSCVNVGGDQAVALSLGFGHSHDENNKTIIDQTNDSSSRRINITILEVKRPSNSDMNCKNGIIGYFLFETIIETKVLIHCTCTYALYFIFSHTIICILALLCGSSYLDILGVN